MAFDDILQAIIAQTDEQIVQARQLHQEHLATLKSQTEASLEATEADITSQKEAKKTSMIQKASAHSESIVKNAELQVKQDLLNELYEQVLTHLTQLPADKTKKILESLLAGLPKEGVIKPSKPHAELIKSLAKGRTIGDQISAVGGFIFESDTVEQNCTYEHIVAEEIRHKTELEAANTIFA